MFIGYKTLGIKRVSEISTHFNALPIKGIDQKMLLELKGV